MDIPELTPVYHTPSKISLSKGIQLTEQGVLNKKRMSFTYPGLSQEDFDKFNDLARGVYQLFFKLDNNDIYEFTAKNFPAECNMSFNLESGHQLVFTSDSPFPFKYVDTQTGPGIVLGGFNYDFDFYLS